MPILRPGALALWCWLAAGCSEIGAPAGEGPDAGDGAADASTTASDAAVAPVTIVLGETGDADVGGVTEDTTLDAANPTLNYGGDVTVRADADPSRVALLRFDVSAVPSGATVSAADLAITTADDALEQGSLELFEVTETWAEGNEVGVAAAANWTQRTGDSTWTAAGAGSGSRAATAMSEIVPAAVATRYVLAIPTDLAQRWVSDASSNHGVILVPIDAATHGVDFISSESANASARPTLTIIYTP
ncbi:MAG TPA: DNRLRE domain-containing protein [Kofleriaceae bacterium]|nr:DNRLRE domain-containing protein [Kofleriaceae bacterium]